ncbi:hypothetical protein MtrunA17_Chr7g0247641 [Medicago truncatula]|nr:hypothetical protein MtrunA17_Chr7g0247641 [Medicago truncatula]
MSVNSTHAWFVPNSQTRSSPHTRHEREPTLVRIACFTRTLAPATLHLFLAAVNSPEPSSTSSSLHPPRSLSFSADLSLDSVTLAGNFVARRIHGEFVDLIIISILKV